MKSTYFLLVFMFAAIIYSNAQESKDVNMEVTIDKEAQFPGGDQAFVQYIYQNIKWPEATKGKIIQDEMTISLDVMPDSSATNVVVLKKVGYDIDEQIVELIKKAKFEPSVQNGTKVKMNLMIGLPIQVRN